MRKFEIYTDGATSKNGFSGAIGGWGWIIYDEKGDIIEKGEGADAEITNNICELNAVIEACCAVRKYLNDEDYAIIYSDSAYIINCYKQKWYYKWQENGWVNVKKAPIANQEKWRLLIPFFEDDRFDFKKVPGHKDIKGNIVVDKIAVNARKELENQINSTMINELVGSFHNFLEEN